MYVEHFSASTLSLVYLHVNPFRAVKLREISILMHLQIISSESSKLPTAHSNYFMSGGVLKKKNVFSAISICLHFERQVEVKQIKTTHAHSLRVVATHHGGESYKPI